MKYLVACALLGLSSVACAAQNFTPTMQKQLNGLVTAALRKESGKITTCTSTLENEQVMMDNRPYKLLTLTFTCGPKDQKVNALVSVRSVGVVLELAGSSVNDGCTKPTFNQSQQNEAFCKLGEDYYNYRIDLSH